MAHWQIRVERMVLAFRRCLIVHGFQLVIDEIPFSILPFVVDDFDLFGVDPRAVLVIEIVLFEGGHFALELLPPI